MVESSVVVTHAVALQTRPAAQFVQTSSKDQADITVKNCTTDGDAVNAKSILLVLTLGVMRDHEILIHAEGPDEQQAVDALVALAKGDFGEKEQP